MKRYLLLAVSVLALSAAAQQLFAAELETPAPREERAAPAAERERAPARERAVRRTPERAPAQRQASSQSPSSSFTGTQVGGFGGGNASGGGFADPSNCGSAGFSNGLTSSSGGCPFTTQSIGRSPVAFAGGAEFGQMFAMGPYAAFGWAVDVTGSTVKASSTQTTSSVVPLNRETITETFSTNQSQPVTTTLRAKIGFVPWLNTLVFATAGGAVGKISGSASYTANNFTNPPVGTTPTTQFGTADWNVTRFGYTVGGGVSFKYPVLGIVGTTVTIEYLYTNLGTVNETIPLMSTHCSAVFGSCTGVEQLSMKTDTSTVRAKLSWGL